MATLRLRNPLQSRSSFSDSDVRKLVPPRKERQRAARQNGGDHGESIDDNMLEEIPYRPSISDRITKSGILRKAENKEQVLQLMSAIFIEIFYQAVRKHFACPICNDLFRKPKTLPSCGHTFCSHCLKFWFTQNSLRSCPICRKFSPQSQKPVPVPTAEAFIKSTEKLWNHFYHYYEENGGSPSENTEQVLRVLGLPATSRNLEVLEDLLPSSSSNFSSPSLATVKRKWAFIQLLHNLRFARLQISNQSDIERPGAFGWVGKYRRIIIEVLRMIIPGYTFIERGIYILRSLATGRGRILVRVPTPEQTCVILIAFLLGCFICTLFQFVLHRGLKAQVKLMLHFASLIVCNDLMEAQ